MIAAGIDDANIQRINVISRIIVYLEYKLTVRVISSSGHSLLLFLNDNCFAASSRSTAAIQGAGHIVLRAVCAYDNHTRDTVFIEADLHLAAVDKGHILKLVFVAVFVDDQHIVVFEIIPGKGNVVRAVIFQNAGASQMVLTPVVCTGGRNIQLLEIVARNVCNSHRKCCRSHRSRYSTAYRCWYIVSSAFWCIVIATACRKYRQQQRATK